MHDSSTPSSASQAEKKESSKQDYPSTNHVREKQSPQKNNQSGSTDINTPTSQSSDSNISDTTTKHDLNENDNLEMEPSSDNRTTKEEGPVDQKAKLEEENKSLQEQVKTLKDKILRVQADYINYRRRMEEDLNKRLELGKFELIMKLIDSYDQLVLINNNWKNAQSEDQIVIKKFLTRFQTQFEEIGIKKIPTLGQKVDLRYHEVVQSPQDISHDELIIVSEIKSGYTFGSRVVRPALVALGKNEVTKNKENVNEKIKN